jgi:hypothetical protein
MDINNRLVNGQSSQTFGKEGPPSNHPEGFVQDGGKQGIQLRIDPVLSQQHLLDRVRGQPA